MSRLATGSVYQIRSGRYAGQWAATVTLPGGRRRTRIEATAREAEQARRELLAGLDGVPAARAPTVADHVRDWLLYTIRPSVRPSTFEAYSHKAAMLMPLIGAKRLDKLTAGDLRAAYARLATRGHPAPSPKRKPKRAGLSPTTIKNAHVVLKAALKQAHRDGLVRQNVAELVTPPKRAAFTPSPFSRAEALAVLAAIHKHRHGPLWTFLLGTGCRIGEAAALVWDDVDLTRGRVAIRCTLTWPLIRPGQRRWERTPAKTATSRRILALPAFVVAALRAQRVKNTETRLAAPTWQEHGFVFPGMTGGPVRANHVLEAWHALLRSIGLKPRRLHDLRASTATLLFAAGFETKAVADQLGHASKSMTESHYLGNVPAMLQLAADRLGEILEPDEAAESPDEPATDEAAESPDEPATEEAAE